MIDKLEMLVALAREKHFGRAAETCNVTQPSLSSAIRALEDQLGVPLVHRGARFIGLTPEGETVLARARSIIAEARALRSDLVDLRQAPEGLLRIGVIPSALTTATEITAPFLERNPKMRLGIYSMTSLQISEGLADFRLDAGLSYPADGLGRPPLPGFETFPLHGESWSVLLRSEGAPAQLDWPDLARMRLCLLDPAMQNRRILDRNFEARGLSLSPVLESDSLLALVAHAREGVGAVILPSHPARFFARLPGLTSRALPGGNGDLRGETPDVALILPVLGRRSAAQEELALAARSIGISYRATRSSI